MVRYKICTHRIGTFILFITQYLMVNDRTKFTVNRKVWSHIYTIPHTLHTSTLFKKTYIQLTFYNTLKYTSLFIFKILMYTL